MSVESDGRRSARSASCSPQLRPGYVRGKYRPSEIKLDCRQQTDVAVPAIWDGCWHVRLVFPLSLSAACPANTERAGGAPLHATEGWDG